MSTEASAAPPAPTAEAEPELEHDDGSDQEVGAQSKKRRRSGGPGHSRMEVGRAKVEAARELPNKRFFRQRAHCNPLSFGDSFDRYVNSPEMVACFLSISCEWPVGATTSHSKMRPDE